MASDLSPGNSKSKCKLVSHVNITQDDPEVPSGGSRSPDDTGAFGQVMMMMAELNERMVSMETMRAMAAQPAGQHVQWSETKNP